MKSFFLKLICFFSFFLFFLNLVQAKKSEVITTTNQENSKVYLGIEEKEDNFLAVKIFGKDLTQPILGLAFDLIFDPNLLNYDHYLPGTFLEGNAQPIYLIALDKKNPSRLVAGISLRRGDELPQGSGQFLTLFFKTQKTGQADFHFENMSIATLDIKKNDLTNVAWTGGAYPLTHHPLSWLKTNLFASFNSNSFIILIISLAVILSLFIVYLVLLKRKKEEKTTKLLEKMPEIRQNTTNEIKE